MWAAVPGAAHKERGLTTRLWELGRDAGREAGWERRLSWSKWNQEKEPLMGVLPILSTSSA